jgi:hypothetical protein
MTAINHKPKLIKENKSGRVPTHKKHSKKNTFRQRKTPPSEPDGVLCALT